MPRCLHEAVVHAMPCHALFCALCDLLCVKLQTNLHCVQEHTEAAEPCLLSVLGYVGRDISNRSLHVYLCKVHMPQETVYAGNNAVVCEFTSLSSCQSSIAHNKCLQDTTPLRQGISLLGERLYEEALAVFTEGLDIAQRAVLGDRVLSTFHDHVAHTILQLRQQRACHQFLLVCLPCKCTLLWSYSGSHMLLVRLYASELTVCWW